MSNCWFVTLECVKTGLCTAFKVCIFSPKLRVKNTANKPDNKKNAQTFVQGFFHHGFVDLRYPCLWDTFFNFVSFLMHFWGDPPKRGEKPCSQILYWVLVFLNRKLKKRAYKPMYLGFVHDTFNRHFDSKLKVCQVGPPKNTPKMGVCLPGFSTFFMQQWSQKTLVKNELKKPLAQRVCAIKNAWKKICLFIIIFRPCFQHLPKGVCRHIFDKIFGCESIFCEIGGESISEKKGRFWIHSSIDCCLKGMTGLPFGTNNNDFLF